MTIDEAISHALEVAERYERMEDSHDDKLKEECLQCAADHRQLAEWLTELKEAKRLLKAAVEDMHIEDMCDVCVKRIPNSIHRPDGSNCFVWRYKDEAEKLLKEELK